MEEVVRLSDLVEWKVFNRHFDFSGLSEPLSEFVSVAWRKLNMSWRQQQQLTEEQKKTRRQQGCRRRGQCALRPNGMTTTFSAR